MSQAERSCLEGTGAARKESICIPWWQRGNVGEHTYLLEDADERVNLSGGGHHARFVCGDEKKKG
jgi:hypothetical protein